MFDLIVKAKSTGRTFNLRCLPKEMVREAQVCRHSRHRRFGKAWTDW